METQFDENGDGFALYGIEDYKLADITRNHRRGYDNFNWVSNFRHGVDLYVSNAIILGENLRGIRNINMFGYLAAFLNMNLTICIVDWDGAGEIMFRPFFDLGNPDWSDSEKYELDLALSLSY